MEMDKEKQIHNIHEAGLWQTRDSEQCDDPLRPIMRMRVNFTENIWSLRRNNVRYMRVSGRAGFYSINRSLRILKSVEFRPLEVWNQF